MSDPLPHLPRIALLAGGTSAEREVSLESGKEMARGLQGAVAELQWIDPRDQQLSSVDWSGIDCAVLALHGTGGEDGQVQQQLEDLEICYTGSGPEASYLAFHKHLAKQRFAGAGLATPPYHLVTADMRPELTATLARQIGLPLAVKPEAQGSSVGVSIVTDFRQLPDAVEAARRFDHQILLERGIAGEEWTVPVLDRFVLPPIRIQSPGAFFDYSAKYEDDRTTYEIRDPKSDVIANRVCELAHRAVTLLGCRGLSRVDLRVGTDGTPWLLEVNTLPGMTSHSLAPRSAAALGWSMTDLCLAMIDSALRKSAKVRRAA